MSLDRRTFVKGTAAATLTVALPFPASAQSVDVLRSTVFGGRNEEIYRETVVGPFEQKQGITIDLRYGSPGEWLTNAIINRDNPEIDLLYLVYPESIRAVNEGVGIEITPEDVPNVVDVYPIWYDGYHRQAVGLDYASFGIAYRSDEIEEPTSWLDLWKPEFSGRLIMPDITVSGGYQMLVTAARLRGGDENNIEPGFELMKELAPNVRRFYKSNPEASQLFERNEAVIGPWFDNRAWGLLDTGHPVRWVAPEERAATGMVSYHIARNGKNIELCKEFVNWAISVEAQEALCNGLSYGPVNQKAQLSGIASERVPPFESLLHFDWFVIEPKMSEWLDRWNREVLRA